MPRDSRVIVDGQRVPFSCQNRRYRTNLQKGEAHSPRATSHGSVFTGPLVEHDGHSLWLEHVEEIETGTELYWLMWYDDTGIPVIPLSGVLDRTELSRMIGQLALFVP